MENIIFLAYQNLTSPIVLCFALGMLAAFIQSDLSIPQSVAKAMSIYLLFAIGFKGGVEIAIQGLTFDLAKSLVLGIILSLLIPWIGFFILKATTNLKSIDAAAVSSHYGSISIVTFVAATQILKASGIEYSGSIVAVAAVMEAPAIISALFLLNWHSKKEKEHETLNKSTIVEHQTPINEVFLNGSIILLLGAFLIGLISGEKGFVEIKGLIVDPFKGVLCFFLLDMGLLAGRHFKEGIKFLNLKVVLFGIYMPILSALLTMVLALILELEVGSLALLMILAASASYIAVPAALRIALPKANPAIYLTMSLAVTFPFNLTVGIPLYLMLAQMVSS
ncbi:MAG: sodium-dependent bicarbonate transport family permease [Pseudomonadota bacterium]